MKIINKNIFLSILLAFVVFVPFCVFAVTLENPITETTLNGFIRSVLIGVMKIGIPLVALAIIYSGFLFVSARGNPESIKKARTALTYTVIGAAILLGAWTLAQLISNTVLSF